MSDLTPGRANIDFYTKISLVSEVSRTRVRSDSDQLQKKMVLMVAIPNFLVLQPLVPFMRHHSEVKKLLKNILYIILNSLFLRFRVRCYPVIRYLLVPDPHSSMRTLIPEVSYNADQDSHHCLKRFFGLIINFFWSLCRVVGRSLCCLTWAPLSSPLVPVLTV